MTRIVGAYSLAILGGLQGVVALADEVRVAHGPEGVGAANEEAARRWHHHDANVVLAGLLKGGLSKESFFQEITNIFLYIYF